MISPIDSLDDIIGNDRKQTVVSVVILDDDPIVTYYFHNTWRLFPINQSQTWRSLLLRILSPSEEESLWAISLSDVFTIQEPAGGVKRQQVKDY